MDPWYKVATPRTEVRLYHMGFRCKTIAGNTLANANAVRTAARSRGTVTYLPTLSRKPTHSSSPNPPIWTPPARKEGRRKWVSAGIDRNRPHRDVSQAWLPDRRFHTLA